MVLSVLLTSLVGSLALATGAALPAPAHSNDSRALYRGVSPLVFQVKTAVSADAPKASYGSGFVVARSGLLATNYHVVNDSIHKADKYKLFVVEGAQPIEARVVAIDVVHDVAIIRVKKTYDHELKISPGGPEVGDKLFSFGIPQDLNLSIVEGLYNGTLTHGPYEQIQMSTPINPGMSGGPTTGANGEVLGLNVAVLMGAQNLTFGVPGRHLAALLREVEAGHTLEGKDLKTINALIERQLLDAQKLMREDWSAGHDKTIELAGWRVRKPGGALKCWLSKVEDHRRKEDRHTETAIESCDMPNNVSLHHDLHTGFYNVRYRTLTNLTLNPVQFFSELNDTYNGPGLTLSENRLTDDDEDQTRWDCGSKVVVNRHEVPLRVNYCLKGYYRYKSLFEARVKFVTLARGHRSALVLSAHLDGFTLDSVRDFVDGTLESVEATEARP